MESLIGHFTSVSSCLTGQSLTHTYTVDQTFLKCSQRSITLIMTHSLEPVSNKVSDSSIEPQRCVCVLDVRWARCVGMCRINCTGLWNVEHCHDRSETETLSLVATVLTSSPFPPVPSLLKARRGVYPVLFLYYSVSSAIDVIL